MTGLFRLTGSRRRDPAIDRLLAAQAPELGVIATAWFGRLRACGPDVRELMHDGCPVACVADAPFAYVNVLEAHVNVGFFRGALLDDPQRLLQGTGKRMRHVKLKPSEPPVTDALARLVAAAYRDIKAELTAHRRAPRV